MPTPPSNGREGKKKKAAPAPSAPLVEVILHDTIIFPEGGGQPSDCGILTSADGELWDVVEAKRHGGHAVHYVRLKPAQTVDQALKVFSPGALVGVALGEEGSKRRLDHVCLIAFCCCFLHTLNIMSVDRRVCTHLSICSPQCSRTS